MLKYINSFCYTNFIVLVSITTIGSVVRVRAGEDGGFWLPNIQRPFVWSEDQIFRLFDSILREYPISNLLIWRI